MISVLLDRTHKRWFFGSTLVTAIGAAAYLVNAMSSINGVKGGSKLGILFGIVGSACMVFAALLAVRRRLPTLRVGSAQFWLRGHMWLGTLGFVLILLHSGFRWGGLLENLMWVAFVLVVVTGVLGVILQQIIPRLLTSEVPLETIVSQIPSLSNMSVFRADKIVAAKVGLLEVDFEPLRMDALAVLKRQEQSIGDRTGDFPKELAKVYANVPFIETAKQPPAIPAVAPIVATKPPLAPPSKESPSPVEGADRSASPPDSPPASPSPESNSKPADNGAAKPKTPLEILREKTAARVSGGGGPKKTPLEILREKSLAKGAEAGQKKSKTPLEIMREKAAAKAAGNGPSKSKTPVELMREEAAAAVVAKGGPGTKSSLDIIRERGVPTLAAEDVPQPPLPPNATPTASEKPPIPIEQISGKEDAPVGVSLMSGKPTKPLITITCERCGKVFTVAPRHAGKQGRCPVEECRAPYTVPLPDEPPAELSGLVSPANLAPTVIEKKGSVIEQFKDKLAAAISLGLRPKQPKISIMCARCGKVFSVSARHAGEEGRCPVDACQQPYTVPHPIKLSDESANRPPEFASQPLTQNKPLRILQGDELLAYSSEEDSSVETLGPGDHAQPQPIPKEIQTLVGAEPEQPLVPTAQRPVQGEYNVARTLPNLEPPKSLVKVDPIPAQPAAAQPVPVQPDSPQSNPAQPVSEPVETPPTNKPAKPLSPLEQMRANKAAAAKGASADQPAGTPKPLTLEKPADKVPPAKTPQEVTPARSRHKKIPAPISPALLTVLRDFHVNVVRPFLITGRSPKRRLEDGASARQLFTQLRADLPAELHDALQQLFVLCEERRQFNTQLRLHRWLHWWLMVHIPPSIALLMLFVAHVVISLRVVPFHW
jgi:ribosomal protein L37E